MSLLNKVVEITFEVTFQLTKKIKSKFRNLLVFLSLVNEPVPITFQCLSVKVVTSFASAYSCFI